MRVPGSAALAFSFLLAWPAFGGVTYMWTDSSGRVQYSDQAPKDFAGPVKRLEFEDSPAVPAPVAPRPVAKEAAPAKPAPVLDMAGKRRAERERLQKDLDSARAKLAAARKALDDHQEPGEDERHIVQRPGRDPRAAPMPGYVTAGSRSNCRVVEQGGKKVTMCPVSAPNEAYFDRNAKLEQAVKDAEEEVAIAERAYRRGVD